MKTLAKPPARLHLAIQFAEPSAAAALSRSSLRRWVYRALQGDATLTLRFVGRREGRSLNSEHRGKDYATNVLTFAYGLDATGMLSADIVICMPVLRDEARSQRKTLRAHAAHLVIHGVLHAQGHDHENDADAHAMEQLETKLLAGLGISDPYQSTQQR
jgi:probable rRNA maturation factor